MNVGQILETHLGWAAKGLGEKLQSLMEKASMSVVKKELKGIYSSSEFDDLWTVLPTMKSRGLLID